MQKERKSPWHVEVPGLWDLRHPDLIQPLFKRRRLTRSHVLLKWNKNQCESRLRHLSWVEWMNAWRNAYGTDAFYEYRSLGDRPLLRYNIRAAWRPMYAFKKVTRTLRWFVTKWGDQDTTRAWCRCEKRHNTGMYIVWQYPQIIIQQRCTWHFRLHAWQCLKRHAGCLLRAPILGT